MIHRASGRKIGAATVATVVAFLAVAACGSGNVAGGEGDGAATVSPAQVIDAMVAASEAYCDCVSAEDYAACIALVAQEIPPFSACETAALSVPEAQAGLRCVERGSNVLRVCVERATCDETAIDDCYAAMDADLSACTMPASVNVALEDCMLADGGGFTCANGDVVFLDWVCDGWDDCGDGSDEEGC